MSKYSIRNKYNQRAISTSDAPAYSMRLFSYGAYEIITNNTKRLFLIDAACLEYPSNDGQNYALLFHLNSIDGVYYNSNNYDYEYSRINYVVGSQAETIQDIVYGIFGQGTTYTSIPYNKIPEWILENKTSYHLDPVYVDKTLVNFTDGTYIVKDGALDATKARSEGYKQLLNTYGTFYKGTERELTESFAQNLSLLNGGG